MSLALVRQQASIRSPAQLPQRRFYIQRARTIVDSLHTPIRRVPWSDQRPLDEVDKHSERVADLAVQFGQYIGLDQASSRRLRQGALLHDEGKEQLPQGLLEKKGQLTDHEWLWIHRHPLLGMEIARQRGIEDRDVLFAILYHHERWDGQGYPLGLQRTAIPLLARIVALCDVFDALRSERSYKAPWSLEETLDYIGRQGGSQFDPHLSGPFIDLIRTTAGPQ